MLELSNYEREIIIDLFLDNALHENYVDKEGFYKKRFMRQSIIWIQDAEFLKKNKRKKSIQNLVDKKVITKHRVWGFQFKIKTEFKRQIYDLLDSENFALVEQLAGVWLDTGI